jgi:isomerase DpgB
MTLPSLDDPAVRSSIDASCDIATATAAINTLCERLEDDAAVGVILLRPGTAAPDWPGEVGVQDVNRWERALRRLECASVPTVFAAHGCCGGPALEIMLATDYRIAASDLRLLPPESDSLFWPGMSVHRLVQQIGVAQTRKIVLWNHPLTAARGVGVGLIDEIVDAGDSLLSAAVARVVAQVDSVVGREMPIRRRLMLEAGSTPFEEALGTHLAACDRELRRVRAVGG